MIPLTLLSAAQGHPILVELKNGDSYNGTLHKCDTWMNLHLKNCILTSKDGTKFWAMEECYLRGSMIKYLKVQDDLIDKVPAPRTGRGGRGGSRGGGRGSFDGSNGRGGRGRGGGDGRGRGRGNGRGRGRANIDN